VKEKTDLGKRILKPKQVLGKEDFEADAGIRMNKPAIQQEHSTGQSAQNESTY
jgi:hypothetical protein